jgi:RHS repeat-associated protein
VLASYAYDAIGRMQSKTLGGGGFNAGAGSVQTGLWTQGSTWQGGSVPGPMSSVSINAGHTVTIPANTTVGAGMLYDASRLVFELGSTLKLNGGSSGGSTGVFPQTIDYSWHIRGGLRGLNLNASNTPDLTGGKTFAMKLGYEDAGYFDGNIGSQTWLNGNQPSQTRSYTYAYDNADRLTTANYGGDTYTVNNLSYDANGNIQTMNRNGADQLAYRYDDANVSNKLLAVTDNQSSTLGFSDGNTAGDDYDYWPDGSLKKDLNRGITDIRYNLLKLPRQLTFSSGKVVQYQYDANGRKLKMSVSGGDVRDYVGPFQYLNNALFEIGHEEGRHSPSGGYEYFHKDHLGNVRVAFNASGITQYTDYDPWGLPLWGGLSGGNSTNRNTFLGKEFEAETGYQDLMARQYDAPIARFTTVDPVTESQESFSTYHYSFNNPVRFSDPNGRMGEDCCSGVVNFLTGAANAMVEDMGGVRLTSGADRTSSFQQGRQAGHFMAATVGVVEMVAGAVGDVIAGGSELATLGLSTAVSVPVAVVSTAALTHGASTVKNALTNSAKDENGRVNASGGRGSNHLEPDAKAQGNHSTFRTDPKTGKTTNTATYDKNPRNPSGYQETKRVDVTGKPHIDSKTKQPIPTPHVIEAKQKNPRPARADELPRQ